MTHMVDKASTEPSVGKVEKRGNAFVQFYRYVFGIGHERNVGGTERTIRYTLGGLFVLAGGGIVAFPVLGSALANAVLALVLIVNGLYLIYEAQVQYCPLNHTIGRSTYSGE
jgi:hypothetical protein